MLSSDTAAPVDRPNLSKDYLAGTAPEEWVSMQPDTFYKEKNIDLRLGTEVAALDPAARKVMLADGKSLDYDRLLLATGAEPVRLQIPGAGQPNVHVLRSLSDSRAIIASAKDAKRAVVIGASFIGLEVAASLIARKLEVHVVAPDERPMEKVLGPQFGDFVRKLHEEKGVVFHLRDQVEAISGKTVKLKSGGTLEADLVVTGNRRAAAPVTRREGRPRARQGRRGERAAGDQRTGHLRGRRQSRAGPTRIAASRLRVEHWVVAQRQGQAAAFAMMGDRTPFEAVPFFWSQHYDIPINYVGHAEKWDEIAVEGDVAGKDCLVRYKMKGRTLAAASIFRDVDNLKAEVAMERERA